jgi:GT2 family glycosyltransferase
VKEPSPETVKAPGTFSSILAVVVLYHCEISASQSLSSLLPILEESAELARHFSLVIYDNSEQPQNAPTSTGFECYVHDPSNGGLVSAYNFALARAEAGGYEWLLLLDQDTSLAHGYLCELVEVVTALHGTTEVGAIVPKLLVRDQIYSPEEPFLIQLRRQYRRSGHAVTQEVFGVQQQPLNAYNSGAAMRVSALQSIGGFPREFWLDYLDHSVFRALLNAGYRIYVMQAQLAHSSSLAEFQSIPIWRLRNLLLAQTLFVKQSGNFFERLLYRIYLLRFSRNLRKSRKDSPVWRQAVLQALLLRVPKT